MTDEPIAIPVEGLSDGRIRIRLPVEADLPKIAQACADEAIQRFTTVPNPYSEADAQAFYDQSAASAASGRGFEGCIVDAETGEYLGGAGMRHHAVDVARWDIGYLVAPWARGRGIATAAVRLLSRFAFDELGAERIEICAEPENEASLRVAAAAGFRREGILRSYQEIKGTRRDMVMHSLLRGELNR